MIISFHSNCAAGNGFSLIEVIVSAAVLSVATLGITSAWKLADERANCVRPASRFVRGGLAGRSQNAIQLWDHQSGESAGIIEFATRGKWNSVRTC